MGRGRKPSPIPTIERKVSLSQPLVNQLDNLLGRPGDPHFHRGQFSAYAEMALSRCLPELRVQLATKNRALSDILDSISTSEEDSNDPIA